MLTDPCQHQFRNSISDGRIRLWCYNSFANTQHASETAAINYDAAGQLTGADRTGTVDDESYDYDANGNRETANGATYTTGANNRLASDGTYNYEYDAEGNRTKQTNIATGDYRTFTWDHRNRLVAVTDFDDLGAELQRVEYAYDFQQHLVGRKVFLNGSSTASESQHFVFDGNQMTLALDDAGAVEHRYLWGPAVDQIMADEVDFSTSGYEETSWALTDHLNTVRDWVAEETANPGTFSVENHITLDTFGRRTAETNAAAVDHLLNYTARYTDPLTGLQWNLHRWYDPQVGRWMSEDWIEDDLQNSYRYVRNTAATNADPSGLMFDFYGLGVPFDSSTTTVKISSEIRDDNGMVIGKFSGTLSPGPTIDLKFIPSTPGQQVDLVQVSKTIQQTRNGPAGMGAEDWLKLKGGLNDDFLEGIASHITDLGWFVDVAYGCPRWEVKRYRPPFYADYQGGRCESDNLKDSPSPLPGKEEMSLFWVGAYSSQTQKWLGFIGWGYATVNGKQQLLYSKGQRHMPPQFRSALDQFVKVEKDAGKFTGF